MSKQTIVKFITCCLALLMFYSADLFALTRVETLEKRTSLEGEWKFKFDDSSDYSSPDYDDSSWETAEMPRSMVYYVFKNKMQIINGIVWLRKTVHINNDLKKESMGLILGRIGNADETFFNGVRIGGMGGFPPEEFSMWNHPRHYLVPHPLIRYGEKNVISIRISFYVFCEMFGTLAITNYDDWQEDKIFQNFMKINVKYLIIFMGAPLLIIFGLFFIRRREQEYLYYVLQLICGFFIILEVCSFWNIYGNTLIRLKILAFSWIAINVAHPIFLHRIYSLERKKTEILFWTYLSASLILLILIEGKISEDIPVIIMILMAIGIGFYNLSCHVVALVKKRPYSKLFSIFGMTVVLGALHDGFVYIQKFGVPAIDLLGYTPENLIFGYSAAALYIGTSLVFVHRFISTMNEVDDLNINLENKVIDRTKELSHAKEEVESAMNEMEAINENLVSVNRELEMAGNIYEKDLAVAANVQSTFLPKDPPQSKEYDIAYAFQPMAGVSGDFYDFYFMNDRIIGAGLFDVSGHGIASGLITLIAKSVIMEKFNSMSNEKLYIVIEEINKKLQSEIGHSDVYLTGILLRFIDGRVEYVNSAHPDILLKKSGSNTVRAIQDIAGENIVGQFLGVAEMNKPFKSVKVKFNMGDSLLLYTDCLSETHNSSGEPFGDDRILESYQNAPDGSSREILDSVLSDFNKHIQSNENIRDDLTAIIIKKKS